MNIDESTHSVSESVMMDDVAALALKIGKEIWGEEQFIKMMENTDSPTTPIPATRSAGTPSFKATTLKHRQKEDSA